MIPEVREEQSYYDRARDAREAFRSAPFTPAGVHGRADHELRREHDRAREALQTPDQVACFGWSDDGTNRFYVGYDSIHEGEDTLVVSWKARAALPYLRASVDDSLGLLTKREFVFDGHDIKSFNDIVFAELQRQVAELGVPVAPSDSLLEDLKRGRTGEMQDIVRTIQAAQASVMSEDASQLLVIQGGPGTGKTAVALHRVSWLLVNGEGLQPADVLVVGPSSMFIKYIGRVLPALGDHIGDGGVRQVAITDLGPKVSLGASDEPATDRLKGEARMMGLIDRALADRVRSGVAFEVMTTSNVRLQLDDFVIARALEQAARGRYSLGRVRLRNAIRQQVDDRISGTGGPNGEVATATIDRLVEQIWPTLSAAQFLQDLFGSTDRLLRAAGSEFTAAEVQLLYRQAAERLGAQEWSPADIPLLDYAEERINGVGSEYKHIVVDEAQDLSPMQLRMIGTRSPYGHITVLGDLAQSTGVWARDEWQDVIDGLGAGSEWTTEVRTEIAELTHGYRVPRQLFDFAARLLPIAAPEVRKPDIVRDGPSDPAVVEVASDDIASAVRATATAYAGQGMQTGVIIPNDLHADVTAELERAGVQWAAAEDRLTSNIVVLDPMDAKGLEFDATVVVEPAAIVESARHGERLLYVCLTRSTQELTVVHSRAYAPLALGSQAAAPVPTSEVSDVEVVPDAPVAAADEPSVGTPRSRIVEQAAQAIANELMADLHPDRWAEVLDRVRELLADD